MKRQTIVKRIGAGAQRDDEDGKCAESRVLAKGAEGEADVRHETSGRWTWPKVPELAGAVEERQGAGSRSRLRVSGSICTLLQTEVCVRADFLRAVGSLVGWRISCFQKTPVDSGEPRRGRTGTPCALRVVLASNLIIESRLFERRRDPQPPVRLRCAPSNFVCALALSRIAAKPGLTDGAARAYEGSHRVRNRNVSSGVR